MLAFVDLTGVANGHEETWLGRFLLGNRGISDEDITIVAPVGSVNDRVGIVWAEGDPGEQWATLSSALQEFLESAKGESAKVVSFVPAVHEIVQSAAAAGQDLRDEEFREYAQSKSAVWPEAVVPLDDALNVLTEALAHADRPLPTTSIRPAMTALDVRFKKPEEKNSPMAAPGLIGVLIKAALDRGLITSSGPADNPIIQLVGRRGGNDKVTATRTLSPAPDHFDRESDRYLSILRAADLGPFQQVRLAVYKEMQKAFDKERAITLGQLLDEAVARVRKDIETAHGKQREYLIKFGQALPWSRIRAFIGTLLTRRAVVLSDGELIRADWLHLDAPVSGALIDWQLVLDGELVVHLVQSGCRIDQYAEVELSGALYNTRQDLARIHAVLKYLLESNICEFAADFSLKMR
jgi:hypothetical protein